MLLSVVPMSSILAVTGTVMANVDEEEDQAQTQASTSGSSGRFSIWCVLDLHAVGLLPVDLVWVPSKCMLDSIYC